MGNLTAEQKQKYLDCGGNHCPYCESSNIEGLTTIETDSNYASQTIMCLECNQEWDDIYTLTDIE